MKKKTILEKINSLDNAIKGSICEIKRLCGKKNCICFKTKTPHKSQFLSYKYQGKTKMIPITIDQIPQLKTQIKNYKELKQAIDELANINADILRKEKEY